MVLESYETIIDSATHFYFFTKYFKSGLTIDHNFFVKMTVKHNLL